MKTPILLIVTLLCAGMLLNSCQKDNSLAPNDPYEQAIEKESATRHVDPRPGEDDGVMADPISNYPDPFNKSTTINFRVWKPTKVSLIVFNENNERVAFLVGQFLQEGDYRAKFNAEKLPTGKYYAVLSVGASRITEVMTKVHSIHAELPDLD